MSFQWPWLLLTLALIPIVFGLYLLAQWRRRQYTVRFTNLALLGSVVGRRPGIRRHIPAFFFLAGLTTLLVSLARPEAVIRVPKDQTAVMLVMDVSGSMQADDLKPTRMEAAKNAAHALVDSLPDQMLVGLVSFNAAPSVNAPLARDHTIMHRGINSLYANGGTAIGEGLNMALDQLAQRPANDKGERANGVVVLLSDGANSAGRAPAQIAQRAKDEGIRVYTIGIGERGSRATLRTGQRVDLDETTLQAIAQTADGEYFYAADANDLEKIYSDLGSQVSWTEERTEVTALFSAAGTVLMLLAGLFSLWWFARLP